MLPPYTKGTREALQVCCDLESLLLVELRELLAEGETEHTGETLLTLLDVLLENLARQTELKLIGGKTSGVNVPSPDLRREFESLDSEDAACHAVLSRIRKHISTEAPYAVLIETASGDLSHWARSLTAHRRHETRVLQATLNQDVGGEG